MKEEKETKEVEEKEENTPFKDLTEEELIKLNEQLKKLVEDDQELKKRRSKALIFHYALHPKFGFHVLFQLLINFFVLSAVIGLTNYGTVKSMYFYLLGITLFTFTEILIRLLLFKFLQKTVIKSYGLIHLIFTIPLLYLSIEMLGKVSFAFIYQRIVVLLIFLMLRFFASYYIKLIFYSRRSAKWKK